MTERDFVYWLQGFVEINGQAPDQYQWEIIKDHLKLVFDKQTPQYEYQQLNIIPPVVTC